MTEDSTEVFLPPSFPFPIKIVSIDAPSGDISRGSRLISYSFSHIPQPPAESEIRFGTWDSALDGTVCTWKFSKGDIISAKRAKERPALVILEPCKHGMQLGGLCVVCGKDMTITDYIGFSDSSRASIQMNHSAMGPTVSLEIAQQMGKSDAERLQKARKLSLIVDLDQTIVHATVDPTVGEWINEGELWEANQDDPSSKQDPSSSEETKPVSLKECNPNWNALKDVKKFTLSPEIMPSRMKNKVSDQPNMYYIKPRPGWKRFFDALSSKYEMHVYTMGTRAYAEQVCKAIDPEGKIFGGRILTRDESGSLTQKSLRRLFPVDTSMVVIIDDRADVWEWSPNLIKVIPYDFFVGIGDINSTFLPKQESITAAVPSLPPAVEEPPESSDSASASTSTSAEDREASERAATALLTENSLALSAQVEERPLAKKSEAIQESPPNETEGDQADSQSQSSQSSDDPTLDAASSDTHHQKALLKNDDTELTRVQTLLEQVYQRYFECYDVRPPEKKARSKKVKSAPIVEYDVTRIIPYIRLNVFEGVRILFSSVIPLDTKPETTEIWRMAHMFGAECYTELNSTITHLVAAKSGTVKVDQAKKRGGIHIVWLAWFTDSVAYWHRQDESTYYVDGPPGEHSKQSTQSEDVEYDDWDLDNGLDVDWAGINDEVDAAMNESDDEEYEVQDTPKVDDLRSDDGWSEETNSSNPNKLTVPRKRQRSRTPSGVGPNGDELRSPLAKRKKIAADRAGLSRLKDTISVKDFQREGTPASVRSQNSVGDDDDDDDFLARELGD